MRKHSTRRRATLANIDGPKTCLIEDVLQDLFEDEAADGFNILPPYLPGGLEEFVDQAVPILLQRGLFRTEYRGDTLREHPGLARPENRYAPSHTA